MNIVSGFNLSKGETFDLSKHVNLNSIKCVLSWVSVNNQNKLDADVSIFGLKDQKLYNSDYFIYYNHEKTNSGDITKTPDQREGGEEVVVVNLTQLPVDINNVVIVVTIFEAQNKRQNFSYAETITFTVYNNDTNEVLFSSDMKKDFADSTAAVIGELVRNTNGFEYKSIAQEVELTLGDMINGYM